MKRPFLILSHHRSGSNFLNNAIQKHTRFECINEPLSMHVDLFNRLDLLPWTAEEYEEENLHAALSGHPGAVRYLKDLREYLRTPHEGHARGVKETLLFEKMTWLKRFLPELRIVYIVRDPRAVAASIVRRNMQDRLWRYSEKIPQYLAEHEPEVDRDGLTTPWRLAAWSWKIRQRLADEHLGLFDHLVIRLEDLTWEPQVHLPQVMRFLGDEVQPEQLEFVKASHRQTRGETYSSYRTVEDIVHLWKRVLPDEDRNYMEQILGREMVRFGYL